MDLPQLLKRASTADLYSVLADTLNALDERGEKFEFERMEIATRYADITHHEGRFIVAWYAEACAEAAALERDDRSADDEIGGA